MSDKKISQLTAATSIDRSEVVPIVQAGVTKKATLDLIGSPIPVTIAALQGGGLADGKYILTDGNNPDLVVTVTDAKVEPQGVITIGGDTLLADFDLANDLITVYYDGVGNAVGASVVGFKFNNYSNNNFAQDLTSDFGAATLSTCTFNNHFGRGSVLVGTSDASYSKNNLYTQTTVDLVLLVLAETFTNNNISLNGGTFTPNKACDGLTVNTINSDYQNELAVAANVIDFNESADMNWTGIVDANGTINQIDNLALAPKNFRLKPEGTNVIVINPATTTNIFLKGGSGEITLDAANGDFMDFTHDGTNVYQAGYIASEQNLFVINVPLSAAQIQTAASIPIDCGLPNAGAGYFWRVTNFVVDFTFVSVPFTSTTLLITSTGAGGGQFQCINILNNVASEISGSSVLSTGILENSGLELYANADSVVGDSTLVAIITYTRMAR